jgi:hypothetical protein
LGPVITYLGVRWALTALLAGCVVLYARQVIADQAWHRKLAWSLHGLMAVAMIAMAWQARMASPMLPYVLVFTAASLYFVYLGVFGPHIDHALYHAVMMTAMVAMAVVMPSVAMPRTTSTSAMAGHGMTMADAGVAAASVGSPTWVTVLGGLAGAGFVGAALWSFVALKHEPHRRYADVLMSLGMGVTFAAMAV